MRFFNRNKGKIHPDYNKKQSKDARMEDASVPELLYFYLSTHIGKPAKPIVQKGDRVKAGALIAKADAEISSNVHSSVSGEVVSIEEKAYLGNEATCVVIKNDFRYDEAPPLFDVSTLPSPDEMREIIREAGIVGMGGAMFPTDVKLSAEDETPIKTLIVNGAECEPYSTSDHRLMIEHANEIAKGISLIHALFPIEKTLVAIENNSSESIKAMKNAVPNNNLFTVVSLPAAYPQGAEQVLIKQLLHKEIPSGKQPPAIGVLVMNVSTIFAVYEAITFGKPPLTRVVTVSGNKVARPRNLRARLGTPVDSLVEDCGGFTEKPLKILHGGPMMGKVIDSRKISVSGGTAVITALFKEDIRPKKTMDCIRCSACLEVCPVGLQPILIHNANAMKQFDQANALGATDCIQCGNCTYSCPSGIELLASIRHAMLTIKQKEQ